MATTVSYVIGDVRSVRAIESGLSSSVTLESATVQIVSEYGQVLLAATSTGVSLDITTGTTIQASYQINTLTYGIGTYWVTFVLTHSAGAATIEILLKIEPTLEA